MKIICRYLKGMRFAIVLGMLVAISPVLVQSPSPTYRIQWVQSLAQYSDLRPHPSLLDRVKSLFAGKPGQLFIRPVSVMTDTRGKLWVLDAGLRQILRLDLKVGKITHFQGPPLLSPIGICQDTEGNVYFTDSALGVVFWIPEGEKSYHPLLDSLTFQQPTGIAYSRKNNALWVVETRGHRLITITLPGKQVRTIGRRGTQPGEFNFPTFIAIDSSGTVYVIDTMNFRVQILDADGNVIRVWGEVGDATGYFARPKGIAVDTMGHLFIVDALFHSVQVFDAAGQLLSYFGKRGQGNGQFWLPTGIWVDSENRIYVADSYNSRIQIFQLVQGGSHEK